MAKDKVFFPNLDGLRFIAFFVVFLDHGFVRVSDTLRQSGSVAAIIAEGIFGSGGLGVSFFFVLSGFLITYLILSEVRLKGSVDVIAFYIRRTLRIWPLYYLVTVFGFFVYPWMKSVLGYPAYIETGNILYYIFLAGNFDLMRLPPGYGAMSTTITWSVAIEEQFYLVWPLLFFFVPRRFYKFIFPAIIVGSALFRLIYVNDGRVLYFHTFSVISDMAVGGGVAYLAFTNEGFKRFFARLNARAIAAVYVLGILLILASDHIFTGTALKVSQRIIFALFFAFIILEQNYAERSLIKMSNLKTVSLLGKYTYGLYMLHPIGLILCIDGMRILGLNAQTVPMAIIQGLAALAASIALSLLSYHLYEKPFLNLKERFTYIKSSREAQRADEQQSARLAVSTEGRRTADSAAREGAA